MSIDEDRDKQMTALLEDCALLKPVALKTLYDKTSGQLYALLLKILEKPSVAEAALQDVYVKIWKKAETFNPHAERPMTWMTSVARYHALDLVRKRTSAEDRKVAIESNRYEDVFSTMKFDSAPNHSSTEKEDLDRCFERLDKKSRECIIRAYVDGYSHRELGSQFSTSPESVKSWVRTSLIALRGCLDERSS